MMKLLYTLVFAMLFIQPLTGEEFEPPISRFEDTYFEYTLSFENEDNNELVIYTSVDWMEGQVKAEQNYFELVHKDGTKKSKIFFDEYHDEVDQASLTESLDDLIELLYRGSSVKDLEIEETDPESPILRAHLTVANLGHDTSVCMTILVIDHLIYALVYENSKGKSFAH